MTPKTDRKQATKGKDANQARLQARERLRLAKREFLARQTDNGVDIADADLAPKESNNVPITCQSPAESSFLVV